MADGLKKNVQVVLGELRNLRRRIWLAWAISLDEFREASWGYDKAHKYVNIRTEIFRAITPVFPRTLAYASLFVLDVQLIAWGVYGLAQLVGNA